MQDVERVHGLVGRLEQVRVAVEIAPPEAHPAPAVQALHPELDSPTDLGVIVVVGPAGALRERHVVLRVGRVGALP